MNSYRNDFTNRLIKKAKIEEGMRILDVGCGTGAISVLIGDKVGKDGEIIGVDIDRHVIKAAQENIHNEKIQFICADINNLPQLGKFDRIIGRQVLMYQNENTIKKDTMHHCAGTHNSTSCQKNKTLSTHKRKFMHE